MTPTYAEAFADAWARTHPEEAPDGHPVCDARPDDDPVSCGWKRAVADVRRALDA